MSGGSYNYLCFQLDAAGHLDLADLKAMADRLRELAPDAAATRATCQLYEMLSRVGDDVAGSLADVWHAVEWCDSGDWGEASVVEALATYEARVTAKSSEGTA